MLAHEEEEKQAAIRAIAEREVAQHGAIKGQADKEEDKENIGNEEEEEVREDEKSEYRDKYQGKALVRGQLGY